MTILAITTLRNEASFLLEWIAHHRAAGVSDFLIYSNSCSDGTDAMLDRLQAMGIVTHVRNDDHGAEGPQWAALRSADRHPLRARADWIIVLDVDEFVTVKLGAGRIPDLIAARPGAQAFALTWRMFGNGGHVTYDGAPVTETFTRAAPPVLYWPWRAQHIKTLFRNDGSFAKLGVHRPRSPAKDRPPAIWVDGSGRHLPEGGARLFAPLGEDTTALAQINHYALGWMETYPVKVDRGRANRDSAPFDLGYWVERNFDAVEDRSIAALDSRAERAALMADPVLGRLHAEGVAWRQRRFRDLMADEPWRALFGRLLLTPPTRVLGADEARVMWQLARDADQKAARRDARGAD